MNGFSLGIGNFLTQSQNMHIRGIGDSKFIIRTSVSSACLSVSVLTLLSTGNLSWDGLQSPFDLEWGKAGMENGWMKMTLH